MADEAAIANKDLYHLDLAVDIEKTTFSACQRAWAYHSLTLADRQSQQYYEDTMGKFLGPIVHDIWGYW